MICFKCKKNLEHCKIDDKPICYNCLCDELLVVRRNIKLTAKNVSPLNQILEVRLVNV